jgi:carboxyl-terminal processing protease
MSKLSPARRPAYALAAVLLVGLPSFLLGAGFFAPGDDDFFAVRKNFTIFGRLYEELAMGYVEDVDPELLMRTGIDAMLGTLDPYTVFLDEADNEDMDILMHGRYGGVGLGVDRRGGKLVVVAPFEGYSGYEQGIRAGDVIVTIDGTPTDEMTALDARNLLRGAPGSTVTLEIEREGEPGLLRFVLTRSEVRLLNVTYAGWVGDPSAGAGYVRLERFTQGAGEEVRQAVERLRGEGTLENLVLDLRGNPGGLLEEAVAVSGTFLPQGTVVVSMRGREAESERVFRTRSAPVAPDLPLVVLADRGSASASEIVAGALQDHDRAVVLGETTFGKGLVQVVRSLPYNTSLKITTARYFTPSGRSIQAVLYGRDEEGGTAVTVPDSLRVPYLTAHGRTVISGHGIEPDVEVSLGEVSELEEALSRTAAFFLFANRYAARHPSLPPSFAVDDAVLDAFRAYLDAEDFEYATRAERALDDLEDDLTAAAYGRTDDELDALRAEVEREKEADFERHAPRLKARLRQEILARYHGESDLIRLSLQEDAQLARALALLADRADYDALLRP